MKFLNTFLTINLLCLAFGAFANPKTWVGGGSNLWSDASLWDPVGVPTATDAVTIPAGTAVVLDALAHCISLNCTGGQVSCGTGFSGNILSIDGNCTFNGGNGLRLLSGNVYIDGNLRLENNAHFAWNGNVVVGGNMVLESAYLGGYNLPGFAGGTMSVAGLADLSEFGNHYFSAVTVTFNGGVTETSGNMYIENNANLVNAIGSTWTVEYFGPTGWWFDSSAGPVAGGSVVNHGTFVCNQDLLNIFAGIDFHNDGTIRGAGSFGGAGSGSNAGTIEPGNSIGTLGFGMGDWVGGFGNLAIEIEPDGLGGANHDRLNYGGDFDLTSSTLTVTAAPGVPNGSYLILEGWTFGTPRTGTFATPGLPTGWSITYDDPNYRVYLVVNTPTDDADGDGFTIAQGDCNDNDNTVYPAAPELCDFKDNDCDGKYNEAPLVLTKALISGGVVADATCFNGSNGAISAPTISAGTPGYAWQWQTTGSAVLGSGTGAPTALNSLAPGNYWVVVDDAAATGCPKAKKFIVKGAKATIAPTHTCGKPTGKLALKITKLPGQTTSILWSTGATTTSITAAPGTYTASITLVGLGACTYPISGTIEPAPALTLPTVSVSGTGPYSATVNTAGGTAPIALFKAKKGTSAPYQYFPGPTSAAYQVSNEFSGLPAGTYRFDAKDGKGCTAFKANVLVPSSFVPGEAEARGSFGLEKTPGFEIFPNPVDNQCFVRRDVSTFQKLTHLKAQVFDAAGRLVFEKDWPAEAEILELNFGTENPPGFYHVKILDKSGSVAAVLRAVKM